MVFRVHQGVYGEAGARSNAAAQRTADSARRDRALALEESNAQFARNDRIASRQENRSMFRANMEMEGRRQEIGVARDIYGQDRADARMQRGQEHQSAEAARGRIHSDQQMARRASFQSQRDQQAARQAREASDHSFEQQLERDRLTAESNLEYLLNKSEASHKKALVEGTRDVIRDFVKFRANSIDKKAQMSHDAKMSVFNRFLTSAMEKDAMPRPVVKTAKKLQVEDLMRRRQMQVIMPGGQQLSQMEQMTQQQAMNAGQAQAYGSVLAALKSHDVKVEGLTPEQVVATYHKWLDDQIEFGMKEIDVLIRADTTQRDASRQMISVLFDDDPVLGGVADAMFQAWDTGEEPTPEPAHQSPALPPVPQYPPIPAAPPR